MACGGKKWVHRRVGGLQTVKYKITQAFVCVNEEKGFREGVSRVWDERGNYADERRSSFGSCELFAARPATSLLCAWSTSEQAWPVAVRGAYNDEQRRGRERLAARLAAGESLEEPAAAAQAGQKRGKIAKKGKQSVHSAPDM